MTTDPFVEAAYAESRQQWPMRSQRSAFESGARWARRYLAAQEPTDAEVLAALNADYAIRFGPRNLPADSLEPYGDETVRIMRAALSAARRDEEKRDG